MNLNDMAKKSAKKEFIIIRKGLNHILLKTSDIAYIYMENEITYIIDKSGKRNVCFENLNSLEEKLDENFFRANRQHIINVAYIKAYRLYEKGKIIVEIASSDQKNLIYLSQKTAPKFRDWITQF